MRDDGIATTAMLGLPGVVVSAVSEYAGQVEKAVETTVEEAWCSGCGVQARLHDPTADIGAGPAGGETPGNAGLGQAGLALRQPLCGKRTWTETSAAIHPRAAWTERARAEACRRVGERGQTVAAAAAEFGGDGDGRRPYYGRPLIDDPGRLSGVQALGVDETAPTMPQPTDKRGPPPGGMQQSPSG